MSGQDLRLGTCCAIHATVKNVTGQFHGERLRQVRTRAGMTQGDVAQAVAGAVGRRHTDTVVRGWEQGHRNPQLHDIVALADLFGISVDYFVGRVEAPDMIVATRDGKRIAIEIKIRRAAPGDPSGLDEGASGAEQVAEALGLEPTERTQRTRRAAGR